VESAEPAEEPLGPPPHAVDRLRKLVLARSTTSPARPTRIGALRAAALLDLNDNNLVRALRNRIPTQPRHGRPSPTRSA
jgi:hypothetical protein